MSDRSGPHHQHEAAPIILAHAVCKSFDRGRVPALDHVDLRVDPGELVAIAGPSGSGKSTLLHLLAALERPDRGELTVNGHDLMRERQLNRYRRHDVGLVFQLHNLLPHISAAQNVEVAMFGTGRRPAARHHRALELLDAVDLATKARSRPPELSGGERQRVAIARALANDPGVLLADEPTGSLDSEGVDRILVLIGDLRTRLGVTIVMVTHDEHVAAAADRALTLRDGQILVATA
jgi:putative ABC transport system ATP-binding protein